MSTTLPLPTAAFNQNFDWIVQNFGVLAARHPNQWIAVDQGRVLAADPDLAAVRHSAAGQAPPKDVVFYFVDDGSLNFSVP